MRHVVKIRKGTASMLGALTVLAAVVPSSLFAAEIIIFREVPTHNAMEPLPPGYGPTVAVPTEERDLILSLVPGPKMLSDGDFGSIVASPPPTAGNAAAGLGTDVLGHPIDAAGGSQPLSNLPGSGMGSFSSLSGVGGIAGQVTGTINSAMQGLHGALGTNPSGSQ